MIPNPLNNAASSSRTTRAARNPAPAAPVPPDSQHAAQTKSDQSNSAYMPYHPDMARRQAGHDTPPSMAYGQMGSDSTSTERLLPRAPERAAKIGIDSTEDIPMVNLSPKARGKRRETPVDPSIKSVTKGGYAPLNAQERLAEIPLTPPGSRQPSIDATDAFGLPLPVTAGKGKKNTNASNEDTNYRRQANDEDRTTQKKNKTAAIAAGVTLGAITVAGATVSTLKSMGKL